MKRFISVFLCSFLLIGSVMPLKLFAESRVADASTCRIASYQNKWYTSYAISNSDMPVYVCIARNKANNYAWELITASEASFKIASDQYNSNPSSCSTPTYTVTTGTQSGITMAMINTNWGVDYRNVFDDIPISDLVYNENTRAEWYEYFFGEGNIEPPGPSYSRPANVAYNTRISGSGAAAANNIDRITWDTAVDSNGTELPQNARVQIRAIPGQYTGTTKQDLLTKAYTDFVIDQTKAVQLVDIIASRGVYETKWSEVTAHFNLPFATFYSLIEGDSYWYRNGWIYQIRLQVDDYFSEWMNIYTATGSGVKEAETITNSDNMTQQLIQQIQTINNLNQTTTNWYISETEINMQPYEEPGSGDKPWWAYLLEAITSLVDSVVKGISNIISSLADLAGDIIDGILGLFSFDSFEVEDWSTQQQQIKDNSGMFGQALDFTHSLQQTFEGVEYQEPILHFDGIELDNVTVIPEQTYNLNDYVESLGLTNFRNIAYLCTDGFIYFSLVLLIIRKLEGIFKK